MIFAIAGIFSVYKKPGKEFLLLLMDIPGLTQPKFQNGKSSYFVDLKVDFFLIPSFKIDAAVNRSSEDSIPMFSLESRQGRHPAFGG